ncbi:hypothetical protein E4T39_07019 [Aureobasidium subglaciale]|nr:hypothetical protein E4T39_07019 [Aureobasidium subglaciale]
MIAAHESTGNEGFDCPVLIVGAGPNGLLTAFILSELGVPSMIIERYNDRLAAPKAHELCPRSLEIFRHAGLDSNLIRRLGTCRDDAYWVNFLPKLTAGPIGKLPFERMDVDVLEHTPEMVHNIAQPTIEAMLQERLPDEYDLRRNHSYVTSEEIDGVVHSTVEDRTSGSCYTIQSRFVIGCDGARSKVRNSLGIEMEGEDTYDTMMTIHFKAQLRPIVGKNLGMLNWVMDPEVSGFIIGYDLDEDQVLICNFDAQRLPSNLWTKEHAHKIVIAAIGKEIPVEVLSFRPWTFSRRVSKSYRAGNVFLVGDAAHCFPPTGGLGLNLGIGDVHNLAWKIAAVHHCWASESILDSFELERRPIAQIYSQQAMKYGGKIFRLLKTMGTTDPDVEKSRRNLYRIVNDPDRREAIHNGIEEQREHFSNLDMHIGYVYGDWHSPEDASNYSPKFVPGIRLPHTWVKPIVISSWSLPAAIDVSYVKEFGKEEIDARRYSTLDLCARDAFTVFAYSPKSCNFLEELDKSLASQSTGTVLPIKTVVVSEQLEDLKKTTEGRKWLHLSGLEKGRIIVIRPDQHILACIDEGASAADVAEEILQIL